MIPFLLKPRRFSDQRGWFAETYNRKVYAELGITDVLVQDNQSYSDRRGTIRGLHCQLAPHAQAKLVRCISGAIFDVAVDLRSGSPTFGHWTGATLTAEGGEQIYVPIGFAHGFVTLTDRTEVHYKCSNFYAPGSEAGVAWDDPDIGIDWPIKGVAPELSDKDRLLPRLREFVGHFAYDGMPMTPLEI